MKKGRTWTIVELTRDKHGPYGIEPVSSENNLRQWESLSILQKYLKPMQETQWGTKNTPLSYIKSHKMGQGWGKGPLIVVTDMNGFEVILSKVNT